MNNLSTPKELVVVDSETPPAISSLSTPFSGSEYYVREGDSIYFKFLNNPLKKVEGADIYSFTPFNGYLAIDNNHVYITDNLVPDADPKTFKSMGYMTYYKDKNHVYFEERIDPMFIESRLVKLNEVDSKTVRTVTDNIIADNNGVYIKGRKVDVADPKTFVSRERPYFSDSKATYYLYDDYKPGAKPILLAYAPLVKKFTHDGYIQIGDVMFFATSSIPGADPYTFNVLDGMPLSYDPQKSGLCVVDYGCWYAKDKNGVYSNGKKIEMADLETFRLLDNVLLQGRGRDAVTQTEYALDKNHAYYLGDLLAGADVKTFKHIPSGGYRLDYASDATSVYWKSFRIEGADPSTFTVFDGQQPYEGCGVGPYSKDAQHVYYKNELIPAADVKTFKIKEGNGYYGEDANHLFEGTKIADPKDFKVCEYG